MMASHAKLLLTNEDWLERCDNLPVNKKGHFEIQEKTKKSKILENYNDSSQIGV